MTRTDYQHLRHCNRWLRRQNKTYLIIAALCLGLGASQLWRAERNAIRAEEARQTISELQASVAAYPLAIYGLNYALTTEQAEAGEYEAQYLNWRDRAKRAEGKWGYWKRTAMERQERGCMLEQMLRDNGVKLYQSSKCEE